MEVKGREINSKYIPTLDGWRAIAVLLVIGAHASQMLLNIGTSFGNFLESILIHAGVGVDIFFALSGYLICSMLLDEKRSSNNISLQNFYIRRAFRIIPPILIYLSVIGILGSIGWIRSFKPFEVTSVIFFFRNYLPTGTWYTGHFWSLAVEEHFYLFAPLLFVFLSWRASLIGVIVLAVFCAIVRWTEVHSNLFTTFVEFRTENRLDGLMYGAVLAHLLHHVEWRSTIKRYLTLPIILVVTIATLLVLLEFSSMPIRRTVLAIALPLLIAHTVLHPQDWIGKLLEYRIMRWLGRMSYSIYIWQMLFFVQGVRDMPILQSFPIAIVATMVCAYVSYQWIEKPMIALGHKISKRLSQPQ